MYSPHNFDKTYYSELEDPNPSDVDQILSEFNDDIEDIAYEVVVLRTALAKCQTVKKKSTLR